ncbi:MAG: triose-phosphate isomerase [Planctomycetota bacterium]
MQLIVGNWKMNGTLEKARELSRAIAQAKPPTGAQLVVAPPLLFLDAVSQELRGSSVTLSAQTCGVEKEGAFTGDVSAEMLASVGCKWTIVGHSERRVHFGETDAVVARKVSAALRASLTAIACVGETLAERDGGRHDEVVDRQVRAILDGRKDMQGIVIAYEPVWAIGTGRVATPGAMHRRVRKTIAEIFSPDVAARAVILYGGSVKPDNMEDLAATDGVDGALVGGASLDAKSFLAIAENAAKGEATRSKT